MLGVHSLEPEAREAEAVRESQLRRVLNCSTVSSHALTTGIDQIREEAHSNRAGLSPTGVVLPRRFDDPRETHQKPLTPF